MTLGSDSVAMRFRIVLEGCWNLLLIKGIERKGVGIDSLLGNML